MHLKLSTQDCGSQPCVLPIFIGMQTFLFDFIIFFADYLEDNRIHIIFAPSKHSTDMLTRQTQQLITKMQKLFAAKPIKKAWLFGSCSRGEERPESDVDILVEYGENAHVTLLTIGGIYMDLKELLGREVDLVEEGTLLPVAVESAERDKVLIYERT